VSAQEIRRYRPPYVYTGAEVLETPPYTGIIDPNLETEKKIIVSGYNPATGGVLYEWTSWSMANHNHDRYVIHRRRAIYDGIQDLAGGATGDSIVHTGLDNSAKNGWGFRWHISPPSGQNISGRVTIMRGVIRARTPFGLHDSTCGYSGIWVGRCATCRRFKICMPGMDCIILF